MRKGTRLSQSNFARLVGINLRSLQNWEIGRSIPDHADLILEALAERIRQGLERKRK